MSDPTLLAQIMAAQHKSVDGCDIIEAVEIVEALLALEKTAPTVPQENINPHFFDI